MLGCPHLSWVAAVCLVAGCTTTPRAIEGRVSDAGGLETHIRGIEEQWRGTPYVLDGETKEGIDGAKFVAQVFAEAAGMTVPDVAEDLLDWGSAVPQQDLSPGDVVFFQPPGWPRHVGIYLSEGEFVHVSPTAGVTISRMEESFWARAYWTSRRIVVESNTRMATPAAAKNNRARTKRIGW